MFPFKKKTQNEQATPVISKEEQERRAFQSVQKAINEGRQQVDQFYTKLDKKEKEIKILINQGKKEDARKKLTLFKVMKDQIVMFENLVLTLEKEHMKNEMLFNSRGLVEGLKMANELAKGHDKLKEDLEDVLLEKQEREAKQQEINALMRELVAGTEEENQEINGMLDEFEHAIHEEKIREINSIPLRDASTGNKTINNQQKNVSTKISQAGKNKADMEIEDELDQLFKRAEALN